MIQLRGAFAAAALALVSCATAQQSKPAEEARRSALPKRLTIIGINDTHGALLETGTPKWLSRDTDAPIGGIDWFAGYVAATRADAQEHGGAVLVLDGGDLFQGTLVSNQFKGKSVVDAYNAIGVGAAAVGNHEFDFSQEVLAQRMAEASFPILAANVFKKGTRERPSWAKPTAMLDVNGLKVGVIGLSTVETPTVTNPMYVTDLEFVPGGPIAAQFADELRAQGATVVVVVAHAGPLGPDGQRARVPADEEAQSIAQACAGKIDALVSGHHHTSVGCCKPGQARCRCGTGPITVAGIPIVQAGAKLTGFSTIDLDLDEQGRRVGFHVNEGTLPHAGGPEIILHRWHGEPASFRGHAVQPDQRVAAIVGKYDAEVKALREERIGATKVTLHKGGPDDLLANFAADALRSGAGGGLKAQFAFQNQGGLRIPEIPAGPITFGQIFDLTPFDNQQVVLTLKAAQLRDGLEEVIKAGKRPLKPSGLIYKIDLSHQGKGMKALPQGALVTEMIEAQTGQPLCKTDSCDASACKWTCAEGDYTVALTDFLANGGDGFDAGKNAPRQVGPVFSRDVMIEYVKQHNPLTPELLGSITAGGKQRIVQVGGEAEEHD